MRHEGDAWDLQTGDELEHNASMDRKERSNTLAKGPSCVCPLDSRQRIRLAAQVVFSSIALCLVVGSAAHTDGLGIDWKEWKGGE
ncbi:hypothetical protein M8818_006412 [Zalaria obscura]|uniref:Uncharacterized protein n=1 Tax=Zalaria obscura TaxID=2024903 RepID=A0ACC3S5M7_9PEZI